MENESGNGGRDVDARTSGASGRDLGEQPLARVMREHNLVAKDLVAASGRPMTFKMVSRAVKGRRLTPNTKRIVLEALNRASGETFTMADLFNY